MKQNEELELKKEFQLERIILFSDAVFAIIVTIMVIDLKLPETIRDASVEVFKNEMGKLFIRLLGYGFSFFFVAMLWTRHVKLFGFLKDYNKPLLVINLIFLFCTSLFPFAVTMITGFTHIGTIQAQWGFLTYLFVIMICMFSLTLLTGYMIRNKATLCFDNNIEEQVKWKAQRLNYVIIPLVLTAVVVMTICNVRPDFIGFAMAFYGVSTALINKHYYPKSISGTKPIILRMFGRLRQKKARKPKLPAGE